MEQPNQEAAEQFQKNNGMSIEEAYEHVKTWNAEGKYNEVVDGCEEITQYVPNYRDVPEILKNAKVQVESVEQPAATPSEQQEQKTEQPQAVPQKSEKKKKEEMYTGSVATDEKIISAIGYIGFLCILPLLLKRDSKYCQFHGKQALILAIFFFLYRYIGILRDFPLLGGLIRFILGISMLLELIIIIIAMLQAYRGKYWKIPGIYGLSQKLKF